MKTLRFLVAAASLILSTSAFAGAQDYAYARTNTNRRPMMAQREAVLETATPGVVPQPSKAIVRMEVVPHTNEIQVHCSLPTAEGPARLELTDMLTGEVLFAGQLSAPGGYVTLPVQNPTGDYEARIITNANVVSTRLRP